MNERKNDTKTSNKQTNEMGGWGKGGCVEFEKSLCFLCASNKNDIKNSNYPFKYDSLKKSVFV